jgi:hypothetical protein
VEVGKEGGREGGAGRMEGNEGVGEQTHLVEIRRLCRLVQVIDRPNLRIVVAKDVPLSSLPTISLLRVRIELEKIGKTTRLTDPLAYPPPEKIPVKKVKTSSPL